MIFNRSTKKSIGIISYCNFVRTYANVNHQYYAEHHGYTYIYDVSPTHHDVFKNKIEKILKYLDLFDWVFWIDDDAFFLQYDKRLEDFIKHNEGSDLIFCTSPVNNGKTTYLSSGNCFLKNTPRVRDFLLACLDGDLNVVKERWHEEYGLFTNGDQDIMVDLLMNDSRFNGATFHKILPYELFNTRPFHFEKSSAEHFLVHFTGNDKQSQVIEFSKKFGLSPALIPQDAFESYNGIYPITQKELLPKTHYM